MNLYVATGSFEDGTKAMQFTLEDGKWWLNGEGSEPANKIESDNWTGLEGSVTVRQYDENGFAGIGNQARALLFDHRNRLAELQAEGDDESSMLAVARAFRFLNRPSPKH